MLQLLERQTKPFQPSGSGTMWPTANHQTYSSSVARRARSRSSAPTSPHWSRSGVPLTSIIPPQSPQILPSWTAESARATIGMLISASPGVSVGCPDAGASKYRSSFLSDVDRISDSLTIRSILAGSVRSALYWRSDLSDSRTMKTADRAVRDFSVSDMCMIQDFSSTSASRRLGWLLHHLAGHRRLRL